MVSVFEDTSAKKALKGIRANSPFKRLFESNTSRPFQDDEQTEHSENPYKSTAVSDMLLNSYLPLIPLRSGMMLNLQYKDGDEKRTRDTNAVVESWMANVKHHTFKRKRKMRPGMFAWWMHKPLKGT